MIWWGPIDAMKVSCQYGLVNRCNKINASIIETIRDYAPNKLLNRSSVMVSVLTGSIRYKFEWLAGCFDLF